MSDKRRVTYPQSILNYFNQNHVKLLNKYIG